MLIFLLRAVWDEIDKVDSNEITSLEEMFTKVGISQETYEKAHCARTNRNTVIYITKSEREQGDLLRRTQQEAKEGNNEPLKLLSKLGNIYTVPKSQRHKYYGGYI